MLFLAGSILRISRRSADLRIGVAPCCKRLLVPIDRGSVMGPGMTQTSLSCSRASRAVIREPEYSAAWISRITLHSPEMMRLRAGKLPLKAVVPGGYSEIMAPPSLIMLWARLT